MRHSSCYEGLRACGSVSCSQQIQLGQTLSQLAFHVFQCFAAPADCTPTCSTPWPLRGIPVSKSKVLRTDHMILAADMVMIMLMLMTNASKLRTSLPLASCWISQAACIRAASGCLGNREKRRNVGFGRIGTKPWKLKHLRLCKYENSNLQTRVKVLPGCGTCKQSVRIQALSRKGSRKGWNWGSLASTNSTSQSLSQEERHFFCKTNATVLQQ